MTEQRRPETFDEAAASILAEAHALIYARCPEVRSLASVIDYKGTLNDAGVRKGVWDAADGPAVSAGTVFGSLTQTLRLLEEQFCYAVGVVTELRKEAESLAAEAEKLRRAHGQAEEKVGGP